MIELETERLILKTLDSSYAKQVLQYYLKNKDFFQSWMPEYSISYFTDEYQAKILEKLQKDSDNGYSLKLFIFIKNSLNNVIGDISISNIVRGSFLSCHFGYKLDESENGKGLAGEALTKVIDYTFDELCL